MPEFGRSRKNRIQLEARSAEAHSLEIDERLKEDGKLRLATSRKILVLGALTSGKTTLMRQAKALFGGYSDTEREQFKPLIQASIVEAAREMVASLPHEIFSTTELIQCPRAIDSLWTDDDMRVTIPKVHLIDPSNTHFFDSLNRITAPDYVPTDLDILHCKSPTHPPLEEVSVPLSYPYSLICPTQGLATKHKWIPCFEGVPAVLFVFDMYSYDQPDKMRAAVELFDYICNAPCFERTTIILFLSTCPALPAKLATSPLSAVYPDYDGGSDYASALRYIRRHFAGMNPTGRMLYVYLVDLMDEGYLRLTMSAMSDTFQPFRGCVLL
ncbi:G-protein alpha subunit-domain-containing protein [Mycena leptocephala]|nr:G-protein alpha subunit-domain-containing protein [Mycena leptocephala]